ncbi:hypothetical protein ALP87_05245, partial [Pseudomonas syringae pv. coriandricola]
MICWPIAIQEFSWMPTFTTDQAKSVVPLLAKTAVPRTGSDNLPGYYSPLHDMWVVETIDGVKPIITRGALDELLTKTKVNTEEDDDSFVTLETLAVRSGQLQHQVSRRDEAGFDTGHHCPV